MDELKSSKNDLTLKIEETDKFFNEQVEILQSSIERNKGLAKEQLTRAKEDFQRALKNEGLELKAHIANTKDEINQLREESQARYEEKLKKIKEVCAQFFNKYDKQLTGYDEQMNELDKRIEDWAKLLVKPQEVNQARLFAIDTRLKETEDFRVRESTVIKDIFKKLIFALEQTEIQKSMQAAVNYMPGHQNLTSPQNPRGASRIQAEDHPLPNLMSNKNRAHAQTANVTPVSAQASNKVKSKDVQSVQGSGQRGNLEIVSAGGPGDNNFSERHVLTPTNLPTYDIIYLKRLLYLKSAIEQEPSNEFQIPITQQEFNIANRVHMPLVKPGTAETDIAAIASDAGGNFSTNEGPQRNGLEPRFNETLSGANFKDGAPFTAKRRGQQRSIDLQDYLNHTTGLDYKKVPV